MANETIFAAGVRVLQLSNATQASDPTPAGGIAWDATGNNPVARALTATETTRLAAQDVANSFAGNQGTINANILTHLATLETWLAANPNGALLNAAQTRVLAQMLDGVGRILLNMTSTIGQAN